MFSCRRPPLKDKWLKVNINTPFLLLFSEVLVPFMKVLSVTIDEKGISSQFRTEHNGDGRSQGLFLTECLGQYKMLPPHGNSTPG